MRKKREKQQFKLSLVVPFYNEELSISLFFKRVIPIISHLTPDYEIICIDDGSTDKTSALLKHLSHTNSRIKIVRFSRNFGKEVALSAGLDHTSGNAIIPIDADLQDPPELIPIMVAKWQKGFDVVLAHRKSRKDGFTRKAGASLFYKFLNWITDNHIPPGVGDFRLMDQKVVEAVRMMPEKTRYMKGILAWVGFRKTVVEYKRPLRSVGESRLSFFKLLSLAFDGIFSFSTKPLKVALFSGIIFSIFSFIYAVFLVLRTLFFGVDLPGYASIMTSILFIGGIQLVSLGIIGEYIARIYKETKNRPLYIVEKKYGFKKQKT